MGAVKTVRVTNPANRAEFITVDETDAGKFEAWPPAEPKKPLPESVLAKPETTLGQAGPEVEVELTSWRRAELSVEPDKTGENGSTETKVVAEEPKLIDPSRFNLAQLYALCKERHITVPDDATKRQMADLLNAQLPPAE